MFAEPTEIYANVQYASASEHRLVVIEPPEGEGDAHRNFDQDLRRLSVTNARLVSPCPVLDREGFTLVEQDSSFQDFEDPEQIKTAYYREIEKVVRDATSASRVLAFDHNIRVDGSTQEVRKPARTVHNDYTEGSGSSRVKALLPAAERATWLDARVAFINAWRPLTNPVYSAHLAVCDARSVPRASLLKAELRYTDRVGEIYYCAFHQEHRWFYFPRMVPREVLLLKVYDSAVDGRARFTPHTAIDDPTAPAGAPARESIEVRTIAFFA